MSFAAGVLACGAAVLAVFALASVPAAAAAESETRQYQITFSGQQSESYSAHYSCCSVERAGYVGCNYTQTGDATVAWLDEWRVTADVFPKSGHVQIGSERLLIGPRRKQKPGDSEISGTTRNSKGNTECSDAGRAGRYDCTAEAVVPKHTPKPAFATHGKDFRLLLVGYLTTSADYGGKSPAHLSCASTIGTNFEPGGFIANDFATDAAIVNPDIRKAELADLKVGEKIKVEGLDDAQGKNWEADFPHPGERCFDSSDFNDHCKYSTGGDRPMRSGKLIIKRVK